MYQFYTECRITVNFKLAHPKRKKKNPQNKVHTMAKGLKPITLFGKSSTNQETHLERESGLNSGQHKFLSCKSKLIKGAAYPRKHAQVQYDPSEGGAESEEVS